MGYRTFLFYQKSRQIYQKIGLFNRLRGPLDRNLRVGDPVFSQSGGEISRAYIDVKVTDAMISTVEGNSDDRIKQNRYKKTNSSVSFIHIFVSSRFRIAVYGIADVLFLAYRCIINPCTHGFVKYTDCKKKRV